MAKPDRFKDILREQRSNRGLTLRELAQKLRIQYPYLSQLESGDANPSEDLAKRVARYFELDEERIVFLARQIPEEIERIKKKFPNESARYFRRVLRERPK